MSNKRRRQRLFWEAIAGGDSSEQAAGRAGVSAAVGARWFREAGGMRPSSMVTASRRYLSFEEREEIALLRAQKVGIRGIASRIGRSPSTVSRELRRNAATRGGKLEYRASTAQWHADRSAKRPKPAKLVTDPRLREYVQKRLSGHVVTDEGIVVGPEVGTFNGRRHGRRKDRRWASHTTYSGNALGCVSRIFLARTGQSAHVEVVLGPFGKRTVLLPVDGFRVDRDARVISLGKDRRRPSGDGPGRQ